MELVGEALVVDAELVEYGGVEVVDGDGVLGDAVAEFVGGAPGGAALDAGAGEAGGWKPACLGIRRRDECGRFIENIHDLLCTKDAIAFRRPGLFQHAKRD